MKTKIVSLVSLAVVSLFVACSTPEPVSKPVISDVEIGAENSKEVYVGNDLHIEASIVAEGKIAIIKVEIHQEDGDYTIEEEFTDAAGKKNTDFHKHISIPTDAPEGEYHLHIEVVDMLGNETKYEDHIEIKVQTLLFK
jgi:hypothetical protein